jgi:hypothetical protein
MEKLEYLTPSIEVSDVILESGFASSTTDYQNENGAW